MNVILTGSSGMVGRATLLECIDSKEIDNILVINRTSINPTHPKVKEVIHKDFSNFSSITAQLKGFDACLYCMGISSVGLSEEEYTKITFGATAALADVLYQENPNMVFSFVSGTGTDDTEQGNVMWARVKGKAENYILNKGFKDAYAFRPGVILPERGVKSRTPMYNFAYAITRPFFPLMKKMSSITTSAKLGKALINSVLYTSSIKHLDNKEINKLSLK